MVRNNTDTIKPWREIVTPAGSTISQVKRYMTPCFLKTKTL